MVGYFFYLITLKLFVMAAAVSSIARMVCVPIGTLWVNVSPDFVMPIIASSKNQNILLFGASEIAPNETVATSRLSVITMRVLSAGVVIIGVFSGSVSLSELQFSIYGGGVLRLMPARRNRSRYSASQNSNTSVCVVLGLGSMRADPFYYQLQRHDTQMIQ